MPMPAQTFELRARRQKFLPKMQHLYSVLFGNDQIQTPRRTFQKWSILPNGRGGVQFNFPRRPPNPSKIPNFSVFINKSLIKTAKSRVSWSAESAPEPLQNPEFLGFY